jgi:hypothetical protein
MSGHHTSAAGAVERCGLNVSSRVDQAAEVCVESYRLIAPANLIDD